MPSSAPDAASETTSNLSSNNLDEVSDISALQAKLALLIAENTQLKKENAELNQALALAQQANQQVQE